MSNLMLIDGNSVGYYHNSGMRLSVGEQQTQAIFGFCKQQRNLAVTYHDYSPLVLWDGHAQWRYDMLPKTESHPGYKGDRDKDPKQAALREIYKSQKPMIQEMLKLLGVRQMVASTHEADDLAGYLANTYQSGKILAVTGDKDWWQLVEENIEILDFANDRVISMDNFLDITGYYSGLEYLQGKALIGDTSDKIPPVGGIGEGTAPVFIAEHRSLLRFMESMPSVNVSSEEEQKALIKTLKAMPKSHINLAYGGGIQRFARNIKLMNLRSVPKPAKENVTVIHSPFDAEGFRDFCERWSFMSILRDFENFISPFRRLA